MKVDKAPAPFVPVTITIESLGELALLASVIGRTGCRSRMDDYAHSRVSSQVYPEVCAAALSAASLAIGSVYTSLHDILKESA